MVASSSKQLAAKKPMPLQPASTRIFAKTQLAFSGLRQVCHVKADRLKIFHLLDLFRRVGPARNAGPVELPTRMNINDDLGDAVL